MLKAVVGIGTPISNVKDLATSFKEAQIAMEVSKVFDTCLLYTSCFFEIRVKSGPHPLVISATSSSESSRHWPGARFSASASPPMASRCRPFTPAPYTPNIRLIWWY